MKYVIRKIFTGTTAGAMAITSSISGIPAIYANELSEVSELENLEGLNVINENGDVDDFEPVTPIQPVVDSNTAIEPLASILDIQYEDYLEFTATAGGVRIDGIKQAKKQEFYDLIKTNFNGYFEIPGELGGETVVALKEYAFAGSDFSRVDIPDTVTEMGKGAFYSSKISYVTIPASISVINEDTFSQCKNLKMVDIKGTITSVGRLAFSSSGIEEFYFSKIEGTIGDYAFQNCDLLVEVNLPNVTKIGDHAFSISDSISSVTLGNKLELIGKGAFNRSEQITAISIPSSVKIIGDSAFGYCENLTNVTISEGVELIEVGAFMNTAITSIEIPGSVKVIEGSAFSFCNNLESIILHEGIEEIGYSAFDLIKDDEDPIIASVTIPNSVKTIGNYCFSNARIESVTLGTGISEISHKSFSDNCITQLDIPSNIEIIGDNAFAGNKITKLNIPSTVKQVRSFAFASNEIEELTLNEGLETIRVGSFYGNSIKNVTIPSSVIMNNEVLESYMDEDDSNRSIPALAFAYNPIEYIEIKESSQPQYLAYNMFVQGVPKEDLFMGLDIVSMIDVKYMLDEESYESTVKEIILPKSITKSIFDPIPMPKFAVISPSPTEYTMYSQTYSHDYNGVTSRPESVLVESEWFADRAHTIPAVFYSSTNKFHGVDYPSDKYVKGSVFRYYPVKLVTLEDGSKFVGANSSESTTLQGKSLMNKEEIVKFLNENTPVKDGYIFEGWDIDWSYFESASEELLLDGTQRARYLVSDMDKEAIKPKFKKDGQGLSIYLEAKPATQVDVFNTNFDAKIKVYGESVLTLKPNQEVWYSLTDGYIFNVNNKTTINFENSGNGFGFVDSFVENSDDWQFVISKDGTKIYAKAPKEIKRPQSGSPIVANIENLSIKNANNFFGDRSTKEVKVFLNVKDNEKFASAIIAKLDFKPSFSVKAKEATSADALSTKNDGTVSLVSDVRYSFRRNTTYVLKLDDEFVFTHDYDTIGKHVNEFAFSNTKVKDVDYVSTTNELAGESEKWRFTVSSDFHSIYVKTPKDLFIGEDPDGTKSQKNAELSETALRSGVSFDINNIGIKDITGIKDNYVNGNSRSVNITVLTSDGNEIGKSVIANLKKDTGNGGGGSGGNGGGSGKTKPKEETVVVADEILIDPYLNGYKDGTVKPKGYITRAEVANIIYKIYGDKTKYYKSSSSKYSDLVAGAWYNNAVNFVIEEDIFVGYPDGNFKPNEPITREEISVVLSRLLLEYEVDINKTEAKTVVLTDIGNSWAKDAIELLAKKGILVGYPDGEFKLKNNTMRSEFASLMNNLTNRPDEYKTQNTYTDLDSNAWYYDDVMSASNYVVKKVIKEDKQ